MRSLLFVGLLFGLPALAQVRQPAPAARVIDGWKLEPVNGPQKITAKSAGVLDTNSFKSGAIQLHAARGENESFQFVVTAVDKPIEKLEIRPNALATIGAEFIASKNLSLYRENFVVVAKPSGNLDLEPKLWPDALLPLDLASKRIEKGHSAVFWANLNIPAETKAGDYFGEIDLLADGKPRRLAVTVKVHDVVLPKPTFRGTVAVYYDTLRDWYAKNAGKTYSDDEWVLQKKRYYDFLLDYGINAYDLPVAWDSPEVEAYLKNPRVLSVRTPPLDSPDFARAVEKLKATGTLNKAFYYWIDEPAPERYTEIRQTTEKLRQVGIKHLVTVHPNEALKEAVDIWAPNIGDFFGIGHVDWKSLVAKRKNGRETWLYTMVEPKWPYPTWLLDDSAIAVRQYGPLWAKKGINGFVYSMAHGWGPKPLENLESFAGTNGDGTLIYPAELVGGFGPIPSIRLMLLRDAIEDYELMLTRDLGPAFYSPIAQREAFLRNLTAPVPIYSSLFQEPKLFRNEPIKTTLAATGNGNLDAKRQNVADAPATRVGWKRNGDELTVFFYAPAPQEKDYVAIELAPRDVAEKWRFVATARGNTAVERHTREGAFRVEDYSFSAKVTPEAGAYRVEMTISLADLEWAEADVRFDALRSTTLPKTGTRIVQRLTDEASDPFAMPLLAVKPR